MSTALTVTNISRTAAVAAPAETTADVAEGNHFANTDTTFLLVRNADGADPQTVTVNVPGTIDGQSPADRAYAIPSTASRYLGPFPVSIYGTQVDITSTTDDLKYTVFRLTA